MQGKTEVALVECNGNDKRRAAQTGSRKRPSPFPRECTAGWYNFRVVLAGETESCTEEKARVYSLVSGQRVNVKPRLMVVVVGLHPDYPRGGGGLAGHGRAQIGFRDCMVFFAGVMEQSCRRGAATGDASLRGATLQDAEPVGGLVFGHGVGRAIGVGQHGLR